MRINKKATLESTPIAVIGMAFRFPGDHDEEGRLWAALERGDDLVTQIPPERWATQELQHGKRAEPGRSITFSAGVLSRIDEFDAEFFGISPREAAWLDPQQRLLLELSWEALENAGVPAARLTGTDCAVYIGISGLDYGTRGLDDMASISSHTMTGNTLSVAANRISYALDLHGPSLAIDTACSSSLVALHHACNSLRWGEASTALVGGVSLLLHPYPFVGFTKASMLSADGRCRPFDAAGNGYVRSEGGAMLLLKPLAQAQADGDEIHAVIRASGVNTDGARKTGITIPSRDGQIELMREVLAKSGLAAGDIDFIETHGTGTPVGDPIEAAAVGAVYGQGRRLPLPISSVKANLGHMEPASGMAGFIKAVLALKHQALPPTLHLQTPNPHIDFKALHLELVFKRHPLPTTPGKPLIAGVNSFGFGGANAHVLLEQYLPPSRHATPEPPAAPHARPPLQISARSMPALRALAQRHADLLQAQPHRYYDIAHAAAFQRERMPQRLLLAPASIEQALEHLRRFAQGEDADTLPGLVQEGALESEGADGEIAFVYAGNGAQWAGMGQTLLRTSARFATIMQELDVAMQREAGFSIVEQLQHDVEHSQLRNTAVAQPLLFALQVAITRLLHEQGVQPAVVLGHSVGEIAAAWASGALSLAQAITVICARSQAQNLTRGQGRMAAVGMSAEAAQAAIAQLSARLGSTADIHLAGINSPANITLSGCLQDLQHLQALLAPQKVFFRLLDLEYAFHSPYMEGARTDLATRLHGLAPQPAGVARFISTVTGTALTGAELGADYWWRNVRQPVRFADAIVQAATDGCRVFVEISPHAILQRYIKESLDAVQATGRALPTLLRNDDSCLRLQDAGLKAILLADAHLLQACFPHPAQRIQLPNYPWQRERYWLPRTAETLRLLERRRIHPLLGWAVPGAISTWENVLDPAILPWLLDHQVGGAIVFPGTAYAEMALAAARQWLGNGPCTLRDLDIISPMVFDGEHARSLRLAVQPRDGSFQIFSRQRLSDDTWSLHAAGRLLQAVQHEPRPCIPDPKGTTRRIDRARHGQLVAALGFVSGPVFQGIDHTLVDPANACMRTQLRFDLDLQPTDYILHPAVLDSCFQALIDFFADQIAGGDGVALLPVKIGKLDVRRATPVQYSHARLRRFGTRSALADFELFDADNQLVAVAQGCRFRAAHLKRDEEAAVNHWRITPWLQPHPAAQVEQPTRVQELVASLPDALAQCVASRRSWFTETLPLMEALALSFAFEGCRQMQQEHPATWLATAARTPYGRWLLDLLRSQQLLSEGSLVQDADLPPARELWQTLLRDAPACLPQLSWMASIGCDLPALLTHDKARQQLHVQLQSSPIAESIYHTAPAYEGTHRMLQALIKRLAQALPVGQRLRVLEISAGLSPLPKTALHALPADRLNYVLALPGEDLAAHQTNNFQDDPHVIITTHDDGLELTARHELPAQFDLIILQHSLHGTFNPVAALARLQAKLAPGAVLAIAERYPDWSADFVHGLSATWWRQDGSGQTASSLLPPSAWQQLLDDGGWACAATVEEPAAQALAEGAYLLLAQAPHPAIHPPNTIPAAQSWLLLADTAATPCAAALRELLTAHGQQATLADHEDGDTDSQHIVWLQGWEESVESAITTSTRLLTLVQTVQRREAPPRLWVVTRQGLSSPSQSALWGLARVVMNECPPLQCTLIDLDAAEPSTTLLEPLLRELLQPDGQNEIWLSPAARHVPMLQEQEIQAAPCVEPQAPEARFRLDFLAPGQLRNLLWLPQAPTPLQAHEIEVHTRATGLNFRDVMYLMGLLPDEAVEKGFAGTSLGLEFSGIVSRVGDGVSHLKAGDAVMGFGASCFASHVVTPADAAVAMPQGWTFEAAATVPTVFLTAYYALKHLARVQPGERVLIHGAAGGVGIAAIQLARHLGAEIFATAGTDEKRTFVKLLGADHVLDSRSLEFADDILRLTEGEGVDVVLNSLAGEAMRRSLQALRPFGRFLELGKRDFFENTPVGLYPFKDNISYFGIDADQLRTSRPKLAAQLFTEVMALFHDEVLAPLPYRSFAADDIVDAFRLMQQARHIGKIVVNLADAAPPVRQEPRHETLRLDGDTTWLITGGLSGFGLASARWLAGHGVRHLALVGRRGADTPGAVNVLAEFAAQGVQAHALACDITDLAAVQTLIAHLGNGMPPLGGVLHAAARFDDQLLQNLDASSMDTVLRTKLLGGWNLHQATLSQPLAHFVLYSSMATAIGNPGQANYVAANMGLEALALQRRHQGLKATCIGWGPIADAGYLARNEAVRGALAQRLGKPPLAAQQALDELAGILADKVGDTIPVNFDWPVLSRLLGSAAKGSRFAQLNLRHQNASEWQDEHDIHQLLADKTTEQAQAIIEELVVHQVAQILCIAPERIAHQASLHDMGMDSLMAVELALGLEQRFGIQLPVMMLGDSPSVIKVSAKIAAQLLTPDQVEQGDEESTPQTLITTVAAVAMQHAAGLSAQEISDLAADAAQLAKTGTHFTP